jgi:3-oxoacyl-[acyl-carrier-protein] synthase II
LDTHDVLVTGMGLRSALGNLDQTWQKLGLGRTGIRLAQPFMELPAYPLGLITDRPQLDLKKLTQIIVSEAIEDAGLTSPLHDCGIVVGSSRGHQTVLEQMLSGQSPLTNWLEALPNIAAIVAARTIQSQSIVLAPMAACATGIWAIARGAELIATGECEQVIVGAVETPVTPLTLAGFNKMGALARTGAYPFDARREGFVLGEGGAILVLESARSAISRGAPQIYGQVLGFGLSADAYHLSAPQPDGKGAIGAIQQALTQAQLTPSQINYIHAHGTATALNDATEARIISELFPDRPWVSSTKGATGHTLGASGALGAVFSLLALHHQELPPNIGLQQVAEFGLNFVRKSQTAKIDHVMCNAFGFGGQNGAIVFGHYIAGRYIGR